MASPRKLRTHDVDAVVERIAHRLADDATRNSLVNPLVDRRALADALEAATSSTWIQERGGVVVGHLYGALLENETYGDGVWIGPDGVSFDSPGVLGDLYAAAGQEWIDTGAREHYAWVFDDPSCTGPWYDLGFARMHLRGVMALEGARGSSWPNGYSLRLGSIDDLDTCVELVEEIDRAQEAGPSFALDLANISQRDDLYDTLLDPDVRLYLVEREGRAIGQCITFPLAPQRGSFDATLHLSGVVVLPAHQGRGVASALLGAALSDAREMGFEFVETNWRVTNRRAHRYWTGRGFQPTYVRLHRTIGPS